MRVPVVAGARPITAELVLRFGTSSTIARRASPVMIPTTHSLKSYKLSQQNSVDSRKVANLPSSSCGITTTSMPCSGGRRFRPSLAPIRIRSTRQRDSEGDNPDIAKNEAFSAIQRHASSMTSHIRPAARSPTATTNIRADHGRDRGLARSAKRFHYSWQSPAQDRMARDPSGHCSAKDYEEDLRIRHGYASLDRS